jgi:ribosomal-protein-alanine N-acetyltransferase
MITSARFFLRPLTVDDVNDRYLDWFRAPGGERIASAGAMTSLPRLRDYVRDKAGRSDVLFLGIFDRETRQHVGNVKFEPVDSDKGYAVFGIFIGEEAARGQGVAGEVLDACGAWLRAERAINRILLGVAIDNHAAIRAYEKVGFRVGETEHLPRSAGVVHMIWELG